MDGRERQPDIGNGLGDAPLADHDGEDIGGAGGSSGGGTIAGRGEPSGGTLDGDPGASLAGLAGKDAEAAAEAAALGEGSGALADSAANARPGAERLGGGPLGAESIGQGVGRGEIGSGTPGDKGDLGGGDVGRSPGATASPGGEGGPEAFSSPLRGRGQERNAPILKSSPRT
ncbi:MAG: hypothetical protein QOJ91_1096 [Sphingomonadales bacterium]|nr:hypothetical protein [Sphingomonadales bacterium]